MQADFHYYATYCAASLAGYSLEESGRIAYCDQLVDCCSRIFLSSINAPKKAATTQTQIELADLNADIVSLQDVVRIWSSFHFLPYDLNAPSKGGKKYRSKYRLICKPNGILVKDTVELAFGKGPEAVGIAMHVLSDTWAHMNFAGAPSLVINNTDDYFYELIEQGTETVQRPIEFRNSIKEPDNFETGEYTRSLYRPYEDSIMNLGHGRAGHLPDYSYAVYRYMPAWSDYEVVEKNNPKDYYQAFCQMVYALKYLRGTEKGFETDKYDYFSVGLFKDEIMEIFKKRQLIASKDWADFGERLTGKKLEEFNVEKYKREYIDAEESKKNETVLGRFINAALLQKSMVTNKIYRSGSNLAGISKKVRKNRV